jgi:hypothetical protein
VTRFFWGTERTGSRWETQINGEQAESGEVVWRRPWMATELNQDDITDAELGDLAADLLATRDELRALSGPPTDVIELSA